MINNICRVSGEYMVIDDEAKNMGIFIGYTIAYLDRPMKDTGFLDDIISSLIDYITGNYRVEDLRNNPVIRAYRDFYWRIGIDPTKTRPSSEALVRRILRGRGFPRINPVVDIGNVVSVKTLVSIGIYDLDKITLPVRLTVSRGGELFKPLGGRDRYLEPGIPILVDSIGKVLHLFPYRDSRETCVDEDTKKVLVVGAGVPGVSPGLVLSAVHEVADLLEKSGFNTCDTILLK